jgi:hypothetical protein
MLEKFINSADLSQGHNDMLDDILDGKPMMIVDSPRLRRQLDRRRMERAFENRKMCEEVSRRYR